MTEVRDDGYDAAYFERAADDILSGATKTVRAPRPAPEPKPVYPNATKRALRGRVRAAIEETDGIAYSDEVNTVTNRIWKFFARPSLADAWDAGFEAGADHVGGCCGCSGFGDPAPNPYKS